MIRSLKPGGVLSYFEYAGIRALKAPFVGRKERARLKAVAEVTNRLIGQHQIAAHTIWRNLPPARVWIYRQGAKTQD